MFPSALLKAADLSAEGATGLKPGVERSGTPGMGIICEQALQARLNFLFIKADSIDSPSRLHGRTD